MEARSTLLPFVAATFLAATMLRPSSLDAIRALAPVPSLSAHLRTSHLPDLSPVRCVSRRLPDSPLARRNLAIALDRLNGLTIDPGDTVCLASAIGPWCSGDYLLAPSADRPGCIAAFGAGAEHVAALACRAAEAAGLEVHRPVSGSPFDVEPVSAEITLSNRTRSPAFLRTHWEGSLPCVELRQGTPGTRARHGFAPLRPSGILAAVGDVALDPAAAPWIEDRNATISESDLVPLLTSADVAVCNLETPITDSTEHTPLKSRRQVARRREFLFRAAPDTALPAIRGLGIDVASLANNHIFDCSDTGISDTLRNLSTAGIGACGPSTNSATPGISLREVSGTRICFLSFAATETLPEDAAAALPSTWVIDTTDAGLGTSCDRVASRVRKSVSRGEMPVVSFHWGIERSAEPTRAQRELARAAAEAGAGIILGHHPHRLQPVDVIDGCVVAYSLGNFVFAPRGEGQDASAVLVARIAHGRPIAAGLVPVSISRRGIPSLAAGDDTQSLSPLLVGLGLEPPSS
ncbi:MAG: CapA family protein [Acidobacteriota bacterium]|nr:CapA family protein [Acidobacteriota bacterium]